MSSSVCGPPSTEWLCKFRTVTTQLLQCQSGATCRFVFRGSLKLKPWPLRSLQIWQSFESTLPSSVETLAVSFCGNWTFSRSYCRLTGSPNQTCSSHFCAEMWASTCCLYCCPERCVDYIHTCSNATHNFYLEIQLMLTPPPYS